MQFRLTQKDLFDILDVWDNNLKQRVFVAACGGTALTIYGHKESTKDVDFLVPDPSHFTTLVSMLKKLGYSQATGNGYRHPDQPWIFDLFRGQTIFTTDLLDPVNSPGKHRLIKTYSHLSLACINPDDLVISKIFRGTMVDEEDSLLMIQSENIALDQLVTRYIDTAGYNIQPSKCKTNLTNFVTFLGENGYNTDKLKRMIEAWNP